MPYFLPYTSTITLIKQHYYSLVYSSLLHSFYYHISITFFHYYNPY